MGAGPILRQGLTQQHDTVYMSTPTQLRPPNWASAKTPSAARSHTHPWVCGSALLGRLNVELLKATAFASPEPFIIIFYFFIFFF